MKKQKFYQLTLNETERVADINIYGDITSWEWFDSDTSAHSIKTDIDSLDVDKINVYINSYGGEVAEAVAIYETLKRNSAEVHTYCDGFACSAASIIFCAGDVRTMGSIALLMIHNCMSYLGYVNSNEMRKAAEDNDKINHSSITAYMNVTGLPEEKITEMMDNETWLTAQEALDLGFATEIAEADPDEDPQQSAFSSVRSAVLNHAEIRTIERKLDAITEALNALSKSGDESDDDPDPDDDADSDEDDDNQEPDEPKETKNKLSKVFSIFN